MICKFSNIGIRGISVVLPKTRLDLQDLADKYSEKYIKRTVSLTGIKAVRLADEKYTTMDYCLKAAENLFDVLAVPRRKVDAVLFVSQTPDYIIPHSSIIIQDKLGLRNDTVTLDINYGCAGYIYGLFQAFSLLQNPDFKNVLLCCGDTVSRFINDEDKALKMVMGDGFSATIISKSHAENISYFDFYADGSMYNKLIIPAGGGRTHIAQGETDVLTFDDDGNGRTAENLFMDGLEVMRFALTDMSDLICKTLEGAGKGKDDISVYAFHQANATIVRYLAKTIGVGLEKVPISVEDTGNTSSCSIPLMLSNVFSGREDGLDSVLMCGFGTGLSGAVCISNLANAVILKTAEM